MATIDIFESITLDGVLQAPGRPDEDTRGGFADGGWANGFQDEVLGHAAGAGMASTGGLLLGHRTYRDLLHHWTTTPEPNPFADVLVSTPKYVVSRSADTVLEYPNSTLLAGDAVETVAQLSQRVDTRLVILGSGELVRALHGAALVDGYQLLIHPIVLGSGTRLFGAGERADLVLESAVTSTTGVIVARYSRRR